MPYQYPYTPYYPQPMQDQLAQLRQPAPTPQPPQSNGGINWVQGEAGAKAWFVAPGNTVLLMDSDGSSFYLKTADASGMPQPLRIFDYKERLSNGRQNASESREEKKADYITRAEYDALAARMDALAADLESVRKRGSKDAKPAV